MLFCVALELNLASVSVRIDGGRGRRGIEPPAKFSNPVLHLQPPGGPQK